MEKQDSERNPHRKPMSVPNFHFSVSNDNQKILKMLGEIKEPLLFKKPRALKPNDLPL